MRLAGLVPHPPSTIGKVLRRHGCSRLPRPAGAARCARRYERERPGELLHIDTKRLGRFWEPGKRVLGEQAGRPHKNRRVGWQHLHVAIDDHSRLAYAELLPGQDADSCVAFLERAVAWYREQGIGVERLLTDNAKAYHSRSWLLASGRLGLERRYTRIYRPRTNGKAERFIQTLLREWAYARSYRSSSARRPGAWWLSALVQQASTPQLARSPATYQPRLKPLWSRQLGALLQGNLTEVTGVRYGLRQRSWLTAWISRRIRGTSYSSFQPG